MAGWTIKGFGGLVPRTAPRMLPENMAEQAVNCDLESGELAGLPMLEFVIDLSASPNPRKAYRLPSNVAGQPDAWLPLPSEYSSVCRSPVANDKDQRIYWTNPPSDPAGPWVTGYDDIIAHRLPVSVGIVQPVTPLDVTVSGGTATVPPVYRSYVYTFVNEFGEESAPSPPSAVVGGAPDGIWVVHHIPPSPDNPPGKAYARASAVRLYRTLTSQTQGAQFYQVAEFILFPSGGTPPPDPYIDFVPDPMAVNGKILESTDWANPPPDLDGLVSLPNGMMAGFSHNTIHFCEPYRPHAWPAKYDVSVVHNVLTLAVWQQSLVVITSGFPSTGSGAHPSNFAFSSVQVPEPCIARGSVIADLMGVYYASQNGLVMLNYYGMQNQTLTYVTKNIWLEDFNARSIIACRHRSQYLALNAPDRGFLIDYSEARLGMMNLSTFLGVISIWNDEYSGDALVMTNGGKVYRWDSPNTEPLTYRWRSKQFYATSPLSLGACQISLDHHVTEALPPQGPPLGNNDPTLALPSGVNAQFRLYVGPDQQNPVMVRNLARPREIFRLPSGYKAFTYQAEIVSRVPIHLIKLARTMKELSGV